MFVRYRFVLFSILTLVLNPVLLANADGDLMVTNAWLRALPPGQPNTAIYLTLHNRGDVPVVVVGGRSDLAERVEFHESSQVDGMWRMRPVERLELAAGETLELRPGGLHIMLFGLVRSPQPDTKVPLALVLGDGSERIFSAQVGVPPER